MIVAILEELGFPTDPDHLKISIFFKKTNPDHDGHVLQVRTTPDCGETGERFINDYVTQECVDVMEPETEYGLHFNEENLTTFTVSGAEAKKIGVQRQLFEAVRTDVPLMLYAHMRATIANLPSDDEFETAFESVVKQNMRRLLATPDGMAALSSTMLPILVLGHHGSRPGRQGDTKEDIYARCGLTPQMVEDPNQPFIAMTAGKVCEDEAFAGIVLDAFTVAAKRIMETRGREILAEVTNDVRVNLAKADELLS